MEYIATLLVALVAIEHIYILVLEMFLWMKPSTLKTFAVAPEDAATTKAFAANQGLYNGFLAVGLIWGLLHPNTMFGLQIQCFFLSCIIIAALYGAATVKKSIIAIQGLPAILALIAVFVFSGFTL